MKKHVLAFAIAAIASSDSQLATHARSVPLVRWLGRLSDAVSRTRAMGSSSDHRALSQPALAQWVLQCAGSDKALCGKTSWLGHQGKGEVKDNKLVFWLSAHSLWISSSGSANLGGGCTESNTTNSLVNESGTIYCKLFNFSWQWDRARYDSSSTFSCFDDEFWWITDHFVIIRLNLDSDFLFTSHVFKELMISSDCVHVLHAQGPYPGCVQNMYTIWTCVISFSWCLSRMCSEGISQSEHNNFFSWYLS